MRLLYNCLLVIIGIPLLGITFLLIMHFVPALTEDFKWPSHIYTFGMWIISMALFVFLYNKRTRWLANIGIFESWQNFKAYMIEGHGYPEVSEQEQVEFMSWANLSEERPSKFRKMAEQIYKKVKSEIKIKEKQKIYIQSLAWYMSGWPLHEDEDEWFEELNKIP